MESIERSMIRYPFIFQIDSAVFSFFPLTASCPVCHRIPLQETGTRTDLTDQN